MSSSYQSYVLTTALTILLLISVNVEGYTGFELPFTVFEQVLEVNNQWNSTVGTVSGIGQNGMYRTVIHLVVGSASPVTYILDLGVEGTTNSDNVTFSEQGRSASGTLSIGEQIEIVHTIDFDPCNTSIKGELSAKNIKAVSDTSFIGFKFVIDEIGENLCYSQINSPEESYEEPPPPKNYFWYYLIGIGIIIFVIYQIWSSRKPAIPNSKQYPKP